jgi:hypothetical protein
MVKEKKKPQNTLIYQKVSYSFDLKMPILQKPWFVKFVTVMTIHICSKYPIDIYEKDTC